MALAFWRTVSVSSDWTKKRSFVRTAQQKRHCSKLCSFDRIELFLTNTNVIVHSSARNSSLMFPVFSAFSQYLSMNARRLSTRYEIVLLEKFAFDEVNCVSWIRKKHGTLWYRSTTTLKFRVKFSSSSSPSTFSIQTPSVLSWKFSNVKIWGQSAVIRTWQLNWN